MALLSLNCLGSVEKAQVSGKHIRYNEEENILPRFLP